MRYILSTDVETNGRTPGKHSMIQLGSAAFNMQGELVAKFVRNLEPISDGEPSTMKWWAEQSLEARNLLDTPSNPRRPPKVVMHEFADWIAQFKDPVLFFAPVMFDGLFVRYYLETYVGMSDLWHRALDMRSVMFSLTGRFSGDYREWIHIVTGKQAPKNEIPHFSLFDAIEQGQWLFILLAWGRLLDHCRIDREAEIAGG